ncbi:MAG TPA: hypothetical protein VJZ00_11975 [Thermoanaerobaculia bacterium]|nr:hypothetical protein [Thermoanaerobaculia bacterium]
MARYAEIVGGSWEVKSVLPESIPHLLHQDLAYLWTLEQQPDQRPKTWATRVEAWKVVVQLFFLDHLTPEPEPLRKPLLDITERFGIKRVTWLRHKATKQIVGVLSPTVIVRPLPDFVEDDLERWRAQMKDNERDLRHLLFVAVKTLQGKADVSPFATRIASVLEREFSPQVAAQRAPGGRDVEVPILQRVTWERNDGDAPAIASLQLSVRSDAVTEIPPYIPSCAACGTLLLHEHDAPPTDVHDQVVKITCSNAQCTNRDQQLPLSNFGIWLRNANVAVIWSPEQIPVMQDLMLPPPPVVNGSAVIFEWNSTAIGGERFRRFLHLRFEDRRVDVVQLMSIFFPKLLVPGEFESFAGSPVRPEWTDAIPRDRMPAVRAVDEQSRIEFRDLAVHGWPLRFTRHYAALSLKRAPELGVGLFPDPSVVGPAWLWFRAFTHGAAAGEYTVTCNTGTAVLPTLSTTDKGIPESITVRSSGDARTGVSYLPRRQARDDEYGDATVSMAVDFGTTNTVIYYQPPQRQHQRRLVPRAETHGLDPRKIARHALWLADNGAWENAESIAAFMPGPAYRQKAADPYIVPSEVWRIGHEVMHLVRWTAVHPEGRNRAPVTHFKWDRDDMSEEGFTPTRLAYLSELVLLALPVVIAAFDPARVAAVKIGLAFPLAFEHAARTQFRHMLDSLAGQLSHLTGIDVTAASSINESRACVNAFGSFNGETFLVADMGGGTLDVALFSYEPDGTMKPHQMGSLRYAGERCVEALAIKLRVDDANAIRDAVAAGESAKKYAKVEAERVITQFATVAFEFLRVMVAAYRTDEARREDPIKVVLVGNGWHLIEAFSTQTRSLGPKGVYHDVYTDMIAAVADPHLVFYDRAPLSEFPSSKHLVVAGALQNVTAQSTVDELSEPQVLFAKLPCGRGMTLAGKHQSWSALVGEGIPLAVDGLDLASTSKAQLFVDVDDAPAPASKAWLTRLENSLHAERGVLPYPTEGELIRELRDGISGGGAPRMKRGPLQIILELEWSSALTRSRGSVR